MDQKILSLLFKNFLKVDNGKRHPSKLNVKSQIETNEIMKKKESVKETNTPKYTKKNMLNFKSPSISIKKERTNVSPTTLKITPLKKKVHNRIYSNENLKSNPQPNPLYFQEKMLESSAKEKHLINNTKQQKLVSLYNLKTLKEKTTHKINLTPKISHKYTKSEGKLLNFEKSNKKKEIIEKIKCDKNIFTYNNNNVVNIFVSSPKVSSPLATTSRSKDSNDDGKKLKRHNFKGNHFNLNFFLND